MTLDECLAIIELTAARRRADAHKLLDRFYAQVLWASADDLDSLARTLRRMHAGGDRDKTPTKLTPVELFGVDDTLEEDS